jgi:hypothetical protein
VPESFHQPRGLGAEIPAVGMDEVNALVHDEEPVGQRLLTEAPLHGPSARERFLASRDQAARHPMDHAGVEVVVAHELLDV